MEVSLIFFHKTEVGHLSPQILSQAVAVLGMLIPDALMGFDFSAENRND